MNIAGDGNSSGGGISGAPTGGTQGANGGAVATTPGGAGGSTTGGAGGSMTGGAEGSLTGGAGGSMTGGAGGTTGDTGGSATGGSSGGESPLVGLAFDIEVPLAESGSVWCAGGCEPATLLITDGNETTLQGVWGTTASAQSLTLTRDDAVWALSAELVLGRERTQEYAMCTNETQLSAASFEFVDPGGGDPLGLIISGLEDSVFCSDDYSITTQSEVVLTGSPDTRLPVANAWPTLLDGAVVDLDKPLVSSATCTLVPEGGGESIPLTPRLMDGYVVGFDTPQTLLPGTRYSANLSGLDYAGVGAPASLSMEAQEDFGVLSDGGFEGTASDGILGGEIVSSYGVEAIDGEGMLYTAPGVQGALHLRRAAAEQSLVLDARVVDQCGVSMFGARIGIRVAVVGGETVEVASAGFGENPVQVTVGALTVSVGELQEIVVPLPGPGSDVLVAFRGEDYSGAGCSRFGLLMDNVRLE